MGLPGEHKQGFWGIPRQKDKTLAEQRHRMREGGGGKYWFGGEGQYEVIRTATILGMCTLATRKTLSLRQIQTKS